MKHRPVDYAVSSASLSLICVVVLAMTNAGAVDTKDFVWTMLAVPALTGTFTGMVAAGIICISGQ